MCRATASARYRRLAWWALGLVFWASVAPGIAQLALRSGDALGPGIEICATTEVVQWSDASSDSDPGAAASSSCDWCRLDGHWALPYSGSGTAPPPLSPIVLGDERDLGLRPCHTTLVHNDTGEWGMRGQLSHLKGRNRSTGDGLYQILPLHARLSLTHRSGAWDSAVEMVAAWAKTDVSQVRNEVRTPGFALLNVRTAYRLGRGKLELGIDNLFDRLYYLPTGGAYVGQGTTMTNPSPPNVPQWGTAVPGPGRTLWVAYQQKF